MENIVQRKWDRASFTYDLVTWADRHRVAGEKKRLFAKIRGKTIMVAIGTGNDIKYFPPGADIVAIDISPRMLERAERKARSYGGKLQLRLADVQHLDFPDNTFDTALTVCTFCSVPNPVQSLKELRRVLKPGGSLLMFEHVRSQIPLFGLFLDFMTYLSRRFGPDLNRDTVGNVLKAGFRLRRVENIYLDIVKTIEAVK